jgi:hypothetical protein
MYKAWESFIRTFLFFYINVLGCYLTVPVLYFFKVITVLVQHSMLSSQGVAEILYHYITYEIGVW